MAAAAEELDRLRLEVHGLQVEVKSPLQLSSVHIIACTLHVLSCFWDPVRSEPPVDRQTQSTPPPARSTRCRAPSRRRTACCSARWPTPRRPRSGGGRRPASWPRRRGEEAAFFISVRLLLHVQGRLWLTALSSTHTPARANLETPTSEIYELQRELAAERAASEALGAERDDAAGRAGDGERLLRGLVGAQAEGLKAQGALEEQVGLPVGIFAGF
jgi:hypothetical protein